MRFVCALASALLVVVTVAPHAAAEPAADITARLDQAIEARVAEMGVPGAIVSLSIPGNGPVVVNGTLGLVTFADPADETLIFDPDQYILTLPDGRTRTLRRPTGHDLRRWREIGPRSRAEAVHLMLDSLVLQGQLSNEDARPVSASIADEDPLVDFPASCSCPACGAGGFSHRAAAWGRISIRPRSKRSGG